MKLNITLTEPQREELEASAEHLAKLQKNYAALEKQSAECEAIKARATARLAAVEKTAREKLGEEAGENASAKAYAIRDQLMQLDNRSRLLEQQFEELEKEAAKAVLWARTEIRAVHRPLVESLIDEATELLAPFSEQPHHARGVATDLYAVGQLRLWTRSNMPASSFRSSGAIRTDIEAIGKTLSTLLAGEPVVKAATGGDGGGLLFPSFV